MPPPSPAWSIDEHDRLVAKLCRVTWAKHGLTPTRVPNKPWVSQEVWEALEAHVVVRRCHSDAKHGEVLARLGNPCCVTHQCVGNLCAMEPFPLVARKRTCLRAPVVVPSEKENDAMYWQCRLFWHQVAWHTQLIIHVAKSCQIPLSVGFRIMVGKIDRISLQSHKR